MKVLVIGSSGVVGSSVCRVLELHSVEYVGAVHSAVPREFEVKSDIRKPCLGLEADSLQDVTHIVYSAGSTRFDRTIDHERTLNTEPMMKLVELAESLPLLKKVIFVSTVYSCGLVSGTIEEVRHPDHTVEFANTYEQSKHEAETVLLDQNTSYQIVIARISTIISDESGAVAKYDSIHRSLQYMYLGLVGILPGNPTTKVDLISSDYAGQRIVQLLGGETRSIYHISSAESALPIERVLGIAREVFEELEPGWIAKGYPKPLYARLETFNRMGETMLEAGNVIVGGAYKALATYASQLCYPKIFDDTQTRLLGEVSVKDTETLFRDMVHYCVKRRWQ